jgi:hypothetical protein
MPDLTVKNELDGSLKKILIENIDAIAVKANLNSTQKQMLVDAQHLIEKIKADAQLAALSKAFGFGCGGVTC